MDLRVGQSGGEVGPRGRGGAAVQVERQVGKDKTTVKTKSRSQSGAAGAAGGRTFSLTTRKLVLLEEGVRKGERERGGGRRAAKSQGETVAQVKTVWPPGLSGARTRGECQGLGWAPGDVGVWGAF